MGLQGEPIRSIEQRIVLYSRVPFLFRGAIVLARGSLYLLNYKITRETLSFPYF